MNQIRRRDAIAVISGITGWMLWRSPLAAQDLLRGLNLAYQSGDETYLARVCATMHTRQQELITSRAAKIRRHLLSTTISSIEQICRLVMTENLIKPFHSRWLIYPSTVRLNMLDSDVFHQRAADLSLDSSERAAEFCEFHNLVYASEIGGIAAISLDQDLEKTILGFLRGNDGTEISPAPREITQSPEALKRLKFLQSVINVNVGPWGVGWCITSSLTVSSIAMNETGTQAIATATDHHGGRKVLLAEENKVWRVVKSGPLFVY